MPRRLRIGHQPVKRLTADASSVALSGQTLTLRRGHKLAAAGGSVAVSGRDAALTFAGADDWAVRSAGAVLADRLSSASTIASWTNPDETADHVSLDTTVKPTGSTGSAKFAVLNTDSTQSGQLSIPLPQSFGNGSTVWFSYRVRVPPQFAYAPWPAPSETGHKISILSHTSASNQPNEVVIQVNYNANAITGYWQDGIVTGVTPDVAAVTACSTSDFRWQPSVDNGANSLSGNDPDTGAAWSACAQDRRRYGGLYSSKSLSQFRVGLGDPLSGAFKQVPDEWITITGCVQVGTFGSFNSRWRLWAAREGQPYKLLHDKQNIRLGSGPNFNALHLLPYTSVRTAGGRKVSSRTSNIGGTEIYALGLATPTGAGTLEYNATTGRFRWAGSGESFGTARGFSSANGVLTINVASGTASESYLVVRVTPAMLPTSGVVLDTITVASGRPDTQVNYADVIVKTSAINAPGGHAPTGGTSLETTALAMSSGQWTQLTGVNGLGLFTGQQGSSGLAVAYVSKMARDAANKKVYFIGCDHGDETLFLVYDEVTNAWTEQAASVPFGVEAGQTTNHGWEHIAFDSIQGRLWFRVQGGLALRRWVSGTTWDSISYSAALQYPASTNGVCFFPDIGANGRIVVFQVENGTEGEVIGVDPVNTATMTTYASGSALAGVGDPHVFCQYSAARQVCYFGGGNGSRNCWVLNASGVVTKLDNPPSQITNTIGPAGDTAVGNPCALPLVNPANGNLILVQSASNWVECNPAASAGSQWSSKSGTVSILSSNVVDSASAYGVCAVPMPEYGVVAFVKNHSGSSPAQMWLWKP